MRRMEWWVRWAGAGEVGCAGWGRVRYAGRVRGRVGGSINDVCNGVERLNCSGYSGYYGGEWEFTGDKAN